MNIYSSGIYKIFTLIAIALVLFGIIHIFIFKDIRLGVDFRGGSLVVVDSKVNVSKEQLEFSLEEKGLTSTVNKFDTPFGYRYEIEIPNPDYIFKSEQMRKSFESLLKDYSESVLKGEKENQKEINQKIIDKVNEINQLALSLGIEVGELNTTNVNELKENFYSTYTAIHNNYEQSIRSSVEEFLPAESFSLQIVSPLLSTSFTNKAIEIAIISAVLVSLYVFFYFREVIPSIAVLIGAFSDLIIALGGMGFFGIPLNLATFAALLMITGYSLDTDTLLTIRMIKRKENITPEEKAENAFKTGSNMSLTAILAFSVVFALSLIFRISLYYEIASVALIGLIGDLFATWGINAVILLYHIKRR